MKIDRIDLEILDALQKDATLSMTDLAAQVGLSQSPCWRRVNLLVATRTIDDYNTFVQKKLAQVPGVQSIDSRIVLEETKNTTELPIRELHA